MFEEHPFDERVEKIISRVLKSRGVFQHRLAYQECYDAAMTAYMYSIHQCAIKIGSSVMGYIYKMTKIYVNAALVVYDDAKNICRENNFRNIPINDPDNYFQV